MLHHALLHGDIHTVNLIGRETIHDLFMTGCLVGLSDMQLLCGNNYV